MSTPNTSLVKWVSPTDLYDNDGAYVSRIPVIPLADLTALVEGLNHLLYANHKPCLGCDGCNKARQALAQLEAREARVRELEDQMNAKRYFTNEAL